MDTMERLRRDHRILRSKLDVLEAALRMGPETWFVLREVCFTLAHQLRDHMKREEAAIAACRGAIDPQVATALAAEHQDDPKRLQRISHAFLSQPDHALDRIRPALTEVIVKLRRHLAKEEAEMFPILERGLGEQEQPAGETTPPARLNEAMTVNRIVHEFPGTKPVFDEFFVNLPFEGCQCLDEVAWRHGMDYHEILARLETVIGSCACGKLGTPEPVASSASGALAAVP